MSLPPTQFHLFSVANMQSHPPFKSKRHGFTLIELLVVMAIMAILAAIGLAAYGGVQAKARDAKRKSDLANIARALEMYYNDYLGYPQTWMNSGKINPSGLSGGNVEWGQQFTVNGVVYMQQLPIDSRHGYFFQSYKAGTLRTKYRLFARLENLEDGDDRLARNGSNPGVYTSSDSNWLPAMSGNECGGQGCNYYIGSTNAEAPTIIDD